MRGERPPSPLERTLARALRELPVRRAPPDLVQQVLQEIAYRHGIRGTAQWPARARMVFFGACGALLAVLLIVQPYPLDRWLAPLNGALAPVRAGAQPLLVLWRAADIVRESLPTGLLESGLALAALFYVALFGLAAVGYRLYAGAARREGLPHA